MFNNGQENQIKQSDKTLMGIFLNQARLNAYITLSHISNLLEGGDVIEENLSETSVLNPLNNWKDPIKSRRTYDLIDKHFPMLGIIFNKAKGRLKAKSGDAKNESVDINVRAIEYTKILQTLLKALSAKRNECCHVKSEDTLAKKVNVPELVNYLEDCFDASVDEVKKRLSLFEDDRNDDNPKDECLHLRRFKGIEKGKKKPKVNPRFQYAFKDEKGSLTGKGLAFLVSIFLDKDDAFKFLKTSGLQGFKKDAENKYRATLLSYCVWRIRLPRPTVRSDDDITGLALDMLNELQKCPKELFKVLSREKQEKFRVQEALEGDEYDSEILLMRYSDRFRYLALRYCDEMKVFDILRFHIDLGKYYFKFYPKEAVNGNLYQRQLDKNLKTFGRIREVKDKVKDEWENTGLVKAPDQIEEGHNEPYIRKTIPHHHIVDNQICLAISKDVILPEIKQDNSEDDIKSDKDKLKKLPRAWISVYQLPGMIFHGLKCGFEKTEALIKSYIEDQRNILREVSETGVIPEAKRDEKFLPNALKPQKEGDFTEYVEAKLDQMIKDTEERKRKITTTLKRMADRSNKPGKKMFIDIRAGKLADFLARDMIRLQPFDPKKNGKDKTTALNFQVLQETLAFFGAKKHSLERIWKELGLTERKFQHPFLKELGNPVKFRSIVDFYQAYLDKRFKYLENLKAGEFESIQFLRPSRQRYAAGRRGIKKIAEELKNKPVNIPSDLFKADIEKFVCQQIPSLKGRKMNTAYLIQEYFKHVEGGHQPVYNYSKSYPVVSKAAEYSAKRKNEKIANILKSITPELGYSEMRRLIKENNNIPADDKYDPENLKDNLLKGCSDFKDNERLLRRYKVQDAVTFMMFKSILKQVFDSEVTNKIVTEDANVTSNIQGEDNLANPSRELLDLKLENIDPDKYRDKDSLFQHPMPPCTTDISITFNGKVTHEKDYVVCSDEKYKECNGYRINGEKREISYRITLKNVKLKDMGKHRRYFHDRRLPGLLIWKYKPSDEIDCAEIEEEIKAYKQHRVSIAKKITELEQNAIDSYGLQPQGEDKYVSFEKVIKEIKDKLPGLETECETIRKIRNAINHNQFPVSKDIKDDIKKENGKKIADKMLSITESYVEQILNGINPI
ncbi:MAG: type VI-B CRISPR-associated RNA-guided ribonuclease Cas13b [Sedimentisphaerales bacterium]|nr:type VI-B CRISPR-associated RNA-guided ribonuclease Cas13b [Sedimentisphaerales bacterium]